ncbi:uncharacterized protein V6R79_014303 [Siganus canaliculatus]
MFAWFSDDQQQLDEAFGYGESDRSGSVDLKDSQHSLMDLGVPCQESQLQALTQQLKTTNNRTYPQDLSRRVQRLRQREESGTRTQGSQGEAVDRCASRQLLDRDPGRLIRLSVRLIPFDSAAAHPGNFEVLLSSSCRVYSLIRMIQDQVGILTSSLEVFRSRVPTEEARLPLESSLEECGFRGGPEESPPEATVFWDYRLPLTDCPILNCDHYFSSAARGRGPRP